MTILNVADIQTRLLIIFPEGTEQRTYLTREMADQRTSLAEIAPPLASLKSADKSVL